MRVIACLPQSEQDDECTNVVGFAGAFHDVFQPVFSSGLQSVVELGFRFVEIAFSGKDFALHNLHASLLRFAVLVSLATKVQCSLFLQDVLGATLHESFEEVLQSPDCDTTATVLHGLGDCGLPFRQVAVRLDAKELDQTLQLVEVVLHRRAS